MTFGKWPHEFDELDEDQKVRAYAFLEVVELRKAEQSRLEAEAVKEALAGGAERETWKKTWPKTTAQRRR